MGLAGGTRYSGRTDRIDFVTAGRPSLLTPELVARAKGIAAKGGAPQTIADACGVSLRTVERWMQEGREEKSELAIDFWRGIQEGQHIAEIDALEKILASKEPRDLQWWLTHHPRTRETWSDAAADRRTERKTMATVLEAVAAVELPAELEQALLLQMQARGLGTQAPEG